MLGNSENGTYVRGRRLSATIVMLLMAAQGCDRAVDQAVNQPAIDGSAAPSEATDAAMAQGTTTPSDRGPPVDAASRDRSGPGGGEIPAVQREVQVDVSGEARMDAEATDVDATGARAGAPATDTPTTGAEANARRREVVTDPQERDPRVDAGRPAGGETREP